MDTFERNAARSLALCYCAYMEQVNAPEKDATRLLSWSRALLNAQRATGIELLPSVALLYPLTGDDATIERIANNDRWIEAMATELTAAPAPARDDSDSDGPSKLGVLAPSPVPRQPSPSAVLSPASRAAQFYRKS